MFLVCSEAAKGQNSRINRRYGKGDIYFYWGWNRAHYTNSDIRLRGESYDFTIYDVVAKDHPTSFSFESYLNPANLTIPQTDSRIGYFFNDHYNISLGFDHVK